MEATKCLKPPDSGARESAQDWRELLASFLYNGA